MKRRRHRQPTNIVFLVFGASLPSHTVRGFTRVHRPPSQGRWYDKTLTQSVNPDSHSSLPRYSRAQLALSNGQDKPEIWIACRGLVYDVSRSRLWRGGMHYEHWAGQELSDELADAPHTEEVLQRFPVIGLLV
jgi:predicted heme/steroid binding protein